MCSAQGNPEGSMTFAHRPAVDDLKRRFEAAAAAESRAELTANSARITTIATGEDPMGFLEEAMAGRDSPPTAAAATVESVGQWVEIFSCIISALILAYLR